MGQRLDTGIASSEGGTYLWGRLLASALLRSLELAAREVAALLHGHFYQRMDNFPAQRREAVQNKNRGEHIDLGSETRGLGV